MGDDMLSKETVCYCDNIDRRSQAMGCHLYLFIARKCEWRASRTIETKGNLYYSYTTI